MSKRNQEATILDLRDINHILKRVREKTSCIKYEYLGDKEDLVINGAVDTPYKQDDMAIGGVFLFLANSSLTHVSPIY